jgi:hypothetical protein
VHVWAHTVLPYHPLATLLKSDLQIRSFIVEDQWMSVRDLIDNIINSAMNL